MTRREWKTAVASVVLWAGSVVAQSPANIVTIRTAGQPERRLQVLKTERLPDGKYLTEVKDLASGAVFTIADSKPLGAEEKASASPIPAAASGSSTAPVLPQAKPRNTDPLLANTPATLAGSLTTRNAESGNQPPTLMGRLRNNEPAAPPPSTAASSGQQSRLSAALFGSNTAPPQHHSPLLGRRESKPAPISTPQPASSSAAPSSSLMNKLFGDNPTAAPTATPSPTPVPTNLQPVATATSRAPSNGVIRPNAVPFTPPSAARSESALPPPAMPQAVSAAPRFSPPSEPAPLTPVSTDTREPNFHVVPVRAMTMKQIEDLVKDLRMHHRPTQRIEAADALARSPMAGMVEVRQILAEASYRDPDPVVRAHCINTLTRMNYDEPNYKQYVAGLVNDDEPAVQRAARAAMK